MNHFPHSAPFPRRSTTKAIAIAFEFLSPATQSAVPAFKALRDQLGRMLMPAINQTGAANATARNGGSEGDKTATFTPLKRLNLPRLP